MKNIIETPSENKIKTILGSIYKNVNTLEDFSPKNKALKSFIKYHLNIVHNEHTSLSQLEKVDAIFNNMVSKINK
jgi:hypothetical protein